MAKVSTTLPPIASDLLRALHTALVGLDEKSQGAVQADSFLKVFTAVRAHPDACA